MDVTSMNLVSSSSEVTYAPMEEPLILKQPTTLTQTTTTVVVSQPQPVSFGWHSGVCSCMEDMKSCCCALWFGNCYYSCLAQRMGEHCCVGCSGYANGCVPGGHLAMRAVFRTKHNIPGSICDDCCMVNCCLPCVMCQIARQMDRLGYPPKDCCC